MMEFTFEDSPWELALAQLQPGSVLTAARFLGLLEQASQEELEAAFADLLEKKITLDLESLPALGAQGQAAVRLRQEEQLVKTKNLQAQLEAGDPLRVYLEELSALPADASLEDLAQQYLAGDSRAGSQLANQSLSRVVDLAKAYVGRGVLLLDLIQEGNLGLWESISAYAGGDFAAHRDWWIHHYLTRAVICQAMAGGLGQKLRQAMADYRDTDQRLLADLGRNPTTEEIAEAMHITAEDALVYADMLRSAQTDAQVKQEQVPAQEPTEEDQQAVEDTAYFQMRQRITELLSVLPEQEAKLLTLRFGLEGGKPMSPEAVGGQLGLTAEEVVAAEAAALAKLRTTQ